MVQRADPSGAPCYAIIARLRRFPRPVRLGITPPCLHCPNWRSAPPHGMIFLATISAAATFACTPVAVWDGDSLWCQEGPRIRLSGIAARETDGSCKPGHPCPAVDPNVSRDALVALVGKPTGVGPRGHVLVTGPTMTCRSVGSAGGKRTAAWCFSPKGGDLSCAMVRGGWAARWKGYWRGHRCALR